MISPPPSLQATAGEGSTALLVVPPFAGVNRPSLALHLLQACAREAGFRVSVFYANLYLAAKMGTALYQAVSYAPTYWLLGERFFAHPAYGKRALTEETLDRLQQPGDIEFSIDRTALLGWAGQADVIAAEIAGLIADSRYPVVGFTTTFEQTSASIALIDRTKTLSPSTLAIIGGANCEGAMAVGIESLGSKVDYIFSGESESSFLQFLEDRRQGRLPHGRIVPASAMRPLGDLPPPDYREYYEQLEAFLPDVAASGDLWLPYESSRGCWWGAKHHCTFCGLNAGTMAHRQKPGPMALAELKSLLVGHPSNKISMVDNIMPYDYFKTFLPDVRRVLGEVHMFYEQKANLTLSQVLLLKEAGVNVIQPGIESLSTPVLKLMDKGVSARKNLELLRFARSAEVALNWNYLFGFPGDRAEDYWSVVEMIPSLVHLCPPSGLSSLSIDRFSPYFERAGEYGIGGLRPMESYFDVLPDHADVASAAYHFRADYGSESRENPDLQAALRGAIDRWRGLWRQDATAPPALSVCPLDDETYLLLDSRCDLAQPTIEFVDYRRMRILLTGDDNGDPEIHAWAVERRYLLAVDGKWLPLATSDPSTLARALATKRVETATPQLTTEPSLVQLVS